MFGRIAEDTMRTEVLPREQEIYNKDWALTRKLLLKAANLDLKSDHSFLLDASVPSVRSFSITCPVSS